jgi:hypothetical protein
MGRFISLKHVLTSAQSERSMSGCSVIQQEYCKTDSYAAEAPSGTPAMEFLSGKKSTRQTRESAG